MKRILKYFKYLLIVPLFFAIYTLSSCTIDDRVVSIEVISNGETAYSSTGLNYDNYNLKVVYEGGKEDTIPLTEDMIDDYDKVALYKAGDHTVHVTYRRCETTFDIKVELNTFPDSIKFNDATFDYDGTPHKIEVEGELPDGTEVIYSRGNEFINAAVYDGLEASLICEGYYPKTLKAALTINKIEYDCDLKFDDQAFTYDGLEHSIEIEGELPESLSVTYEIKEKGSPNDFTLGRSASAYGIYTVRAVFTNTNSNYKNTINGSRYLEATLSINKAQYDLSHFKFEDKTVTYDGEYHTITLEPESPEYTLPSSILVSYYYDDDLQTSESLRGVKNVHTGLTDYYVVEAYFLSSNPNYEIPDPMIAYLTIEPAVVDLSSISFDSNSYTYEKDEEHRYCKKCGKSHLVSELDENGKCPDCHSAVSEVGINQSLYCNVDKKACEERNVESVDLPRSVLFLGYTESIDSTDYKDKIEKSDAGLYTMYAKFECIDYNHKLENNGAIEAVLEIRKSKFVMDRTKCSYPSETVVYDGKPHVINFEIDVEYAKTLPDYIWSPGVLGETAGRYTDVGEYYFEKEFKSKNNNYEVTNGSFFATLTIVPCEVDLNVTGLVDQEFLYDGESHQLDFDIIIPINEETGEPLIDVEVKYYIKQGDFYVPYTKTGFKDIGIYHIRVEFSTPDANYKIINNTYDIRLIIDG